MKAQRFVLKPKPGEIVEVRNEKEVAATLDSDNTLDGLSFTPEMFRYCGKKFRVLKSINKIFVEGIGTRSIKNTMVLEGTFCHGEAHGNCQRMCLLLWKEAWLKRPQEKGTDSVISTDQTISKQIIDNVPCQSASLRKATSQVISFEDFIKTYLCDERFKKWFVLKKTGALSLWLTLKVKRYLGQKRDSALCGFLKKTPSIPLNLRPGELIEVKNKADIVMTLDTDGKNRGLGFTPEMLKYCGQRFRILKRINKIIEEQTGQMKHTANTVILENVTCDGSSHADCPRNCYLLWREIWLKRV